MLQLALSFLYRASSIARPGIYASACFSVALHPVAHAPASLAIAVQINVADPAAVTIAGGTETTTRIANLNRNRRGRVDGRPGWSRLDLRRCGSWWQWPCRYRTINRRGGRSATRHRTGIGLRLCSSRRSCILCFADGIGDLRGRLGSGFRRHGSASTQQRCEEQKSKQMFYCNFGKRIHCNWIVPGPDCSTNSLRAPAARHAGRNASQILTAGP